MSFRFVRKAGLTALFLCAARLSAAQATVSCGEPGDCLDAVMAAARSGRQIDEIALMKQMSRASAAAKRRPGKRAATPQPADSLAVGDIDATLASLQRDAEQAPGLPEY